MSVVALSSVVATLALAYVAACTVSPKTGLEPLQGPMPDANGAVVLPPHKALPPDDGDTPTPSPSAVPTTTTPAPVQPRQAPPPQAPPPPPPTYNGPPARNPAEAVAAAASVGASRGVRVAVALEDRRTGVIYAAGDYNGSFASASVVKTFIAARLLVDGQAADPAIKDKMWEMIVGSNDDDASDLYPVAGGEGLVGWIANRYHLSGLQPANMPGYWGLTRITAHAMVDFYADIAVDTKVGPWLMDAMANAKPTADDGFAQLFGLPAVAKSWRVKQGWMCCLENITRMHSTGFIDGDRYTAALMIEGARGVYGNSGATTLNIMAKALLPNGSVPQPAPTTTPPPPPPPPPSPSPTPTPSRSPSPSPTATPSPTPSSAKPWTV